MSLLERQRAASAAPKTVVDLTKDSKATLAPPSPSPSVASTTSALAGGSGTAASTPKKKRPGDGIEIYSQPALTGTGMELGTQLVYAVTHLKSKGSALPLRDIVDHLSRRPANEAELTEVAEGLRRHPRVKWIPDSKLSQQSADSGTYVHNPVIPGVTSKETLLQYLQSKKDAMFVDVKDLEDGWPKARLFPAIAELESEHKVLVIRTKKDNVPKFVWQDDASLWKTVEPEFQNSWHKISVPKVDEITRMLKANGQKPTSDDPSLKVAKVDKPKIKKKKKAPKNVTNTHLKGHLNMFKDL
ncbi:unnamed protein product [Discula destructiva]